MNCPIDDTTLSITHRDNIEIDYCPKCRGVWLDRGELDKIISGNKSSYSDSPQHYTNYDEDYDKHHKKKSSGSFLDDLFDFYLQLKSNNY